MHLGVLIQPSCPSEDLRIVMIKEGRTINKMLRPRPDKRVTLIEGSSNYRCHLQRDLGGANKM